MRYINIFLRESTLSGPIGPYDIYHTTGSVNSLYETSSYAIDGPCGTNFQIAEDVYIATSSALQGGLAIPDNTTFIKVKNKNISGAGEERVLNLSNLSGSYQPTTTTTTTTTVAPDKFVEITVNNNSGIYFSGSAFGWQARAYKLPGNVFGPYLYTLETGSNYVSGSLTYTGVEENCGCNIVFDNNIESWTSIQVTSSMYLDGILTASFNEVVNSTEPTPQSGINNSNMNTNLFASYSYEFEINPN